MRSSSGWLSSGAGSSFRTAAIVSAGEGRANTRRPLIASYSSEPSEKMSLVGSAFSPRTCSGDMYGNVPKTVPGCVTGGSYFVTASSGGSETGRVMYASPKSMSFTRSSGVIRTLSGFKSRWTMPLACATARASAI